MFGYFKNKPFLFLAFSSFFTTIIVTIIYLKTYDKTPYLLSGKDTSGLYLLVFAACVSILIVLFLGNVTLSSLFYNKVIMK